MMQSVEKMYRSLAALNGGGIAVFPQRCVLVRNRNAGCLRCARVCTSGAISVCDESISVDEGKCIGCGTCATACPTCALEMCDPSDKELFESVRGAMSGGDGHAVIACGEVREGHAAEQGDALQAVGVKCLGRVDESLLIAVLAAPWTQSVTLLHGDCEACPHKAGREMASDVVCSANAVLEAWGARSRVHIERAEDALAPVRQSPVDKGDDAGDPGEFQLAKVGRDGTLPHHVPARRKRLVAALRALGPAPDASVDTRLWGHVSIDTEKCVSCRMCATFCPAGAIEKWDEDGQFGLAHQARLCVKCRCCESICPIGAISVSESVSARSLAEGCVDYLPLEKPSFQRGDGHATKGIFGSLLGTEDIFDR